MMIALFLVIQPSAAWSTGPERSPSARRTMAGAATPKLAATTKRPSATICSNGRDVASAITVAAETTITTFFSFAAANRNASPNAFLTFLESTADIHVGMSGAAPSWGRADHFLAARASRIAPSAIFSQLTQRGDELPCSATSITAITTPPTTVRPSSYPPRNARETLGGRWWLGPA